MLMLSAVSQYANKFYRLLFFSSAGSSLLLYYSLCLPGTHKMIPIILEFSNPNSVICIITLKYLLHFITFGYR